MNKFVLQLADMPWAKVFVMGVVALGIYYAAFRDDGAMQTSNLENEKQQLDASTRQLQATKRAMDNAEKFENEILTAKKEFERVSEFMPPKLSVADLTTMLSERSAKAGVRLLSTAPVSSRQSEANASPYFDSIRVSFKIEGSFAQILSFLSLTSRDPRMVMFEETELEASASSTAEAPVLTFGGELVGFRYKKEIKKAASAADPGSGGGNAVP